MKAKLITRNVQSLSPRERAYDVRDSDLSGFLLRVLPTGGMSYFCDFRYADGRRTRLKLGDATILTPMQARDEAHKVLGDVARGIDPVAARRAARRAARLESLETFITKRYEPWVVAHRKTGAKTVKSALRAFSEFKESQLSDISPWKVDKWRSGRLNAGNVEATVNRNVTMLKAILQKAVEWEVIESNPLAKVKPLEFDNAAKVRYLSPEEEMRLRHALDTREERIRAERRSHNDWCSVRGYAPFPLLDQFRFADHLKPMVLLSINTGLRRGELFNLKWEDVDLNQRILTVTGKTAKSGKTRHIPLNREAFDVLTNWLAQGRVGTSLVFLGRDGQRFDNVNTSWESVLSTAKIGGFRWHDMRHHFASMLIMRGVDLNTVRELLGHGDLKMTIRYAHLAPQFKAEAVEKLSLARFTVSPTFLLHADAS